MAATAETIHGELKDSAAASASPASNSFFHPSANDPEQAVPAHRPRPAPHLPSVRAVTDREEDDFGAADDVLERHIADPAARRRHSAVVGVVAVVAHHEEMPGRYEVGRRVVVQGILDAIERLVADAIRQGLAPEPDSSWVLAHVAVDIVLRALAFHRDPVDVQQAVDHLNT